MTTPDKLRNIGDQVVVFDAKGNYELRGTIVGRYACDPPLYDIQPNRRESLSKRLCGIPERRLRNVGKEIIAYEGMQPEPQHILDHA